MTVATVEFFGGVCAAPLSLKYSVFRSVTATKSCTPVDCSWADLVTEALAPKLYPTKEAQPLIKLATFGDKPNAKDSIRYDGNVDQVYGMEADYDGGKVRPEEAARLLREAGIRAVVYTSASHTREYPRWRVLAPLQWPVAPADRAKYMSMINGVLGGILAPESWVLSQPYYLGAVEGVEYQAIEVEGECIDLVADVDGLVELPPASKVKAAVEPLKPRSAADINDPVVDYLYEKGFVKSVGADGVVHVVCPFSGEHTTESKETTSSYFPQGLGGLPNAGYECRHSHCAERHVGHFLHAIGYEDSLFEDERRRHQVEENIRIGDGVERAPIAELIGLDAALRRFVFLSDGSRVADAFNPHYDLAYPDWAATYAASKMEIAQPPKTLASGKTKDTPPKLVPVPELWRSSPKRQTAVCRTFKADGPATLHDPDGRLALNSWKPFDRSRPVSDDAAGKLDLFVEQVRFLFGEDADRFLDWLAHIEQKPGVLPHTAWLHIATSFGMGRNWLASVLARVWAGSVASNLDLVDLLESGFNSRLSRKVLATVDEVREGGRGEQWAHAERLKSLVNEETRAINPKYGRRSLEYNACRWLVFSNHISALPVEDADRRWQVVINEAAPRDPGYYSRLYGALEDPDFIGTVAAYLAQRDLSAFNPGAKARDTQAKAAVVQASKSPLDQWIDLIVTHWPCDVATSGQIAAVLGHAEEGGLSPAHRRALERRGIAALGRPVRLGGQPARLSIVRNKDFWSTRSAGELKDEWERGAAVLGEDADFNLRGFLLGAAADQGAMK